MVSEHESIQSSSVKLELNMQDSDETSIYNSLGINNNYLRNEENFASLLQDTFDYYDLHNQKRLSLRPYCGWAVYGLPSDNIILSSLDFRRRHRMMCSIAALGAYTAKKNGIALNLGCGSGGDTLALTMMGAKVVAVDGAQSAINLTHEVAVATGTAHLVQTYQAETMVFLERAIRDGVKYDVVVCAFSLSGTPNPAQAVNQIVQVLKPSGYLYVVDSPPLRTSNYKNGLLTLVQERTLETRTFPVLKTYFQDDKTYRYIANAMETAGLEVIFSSSALFPQEEYYAETVGRLPSETIVGVLFNDTSFFSSIDKQRSILAKTLAPICNTSS